MLENTGEVWHRYFFFIGIGEGSSNKLDESLWECSSRKHYKRWSSLNRYGLIGFSKMLTLGMQSRYAKEVTMGQINMNGVYYTFTVGY